MSIATAKNNYIRILRHRITEQTTVFERENTWVGIGYHPCVFSPKSSEFKSFETPITYIDIRESDVQVIPYSCIACPVI
jgi:hypothetical protein